MSEIKRSPAGLRAGGRRLWRAVLAEYELAPKEIELLEAACRTRDALDALQTVTEAAEAAGDWRTHRQALAEARQQRLTLARLLAALGLEDEDGEQMPVRAPRGVYRLRGIG